MIDFEYEEYSTETHKGMRFYRIGEHLYPSVTSVLGLTAAPEKKASLESWRQSLGPVKADAYTKSCADRGTILHSMLEQHLRGEEVNVKGMTNVEWGMFHGIKIKLKKIDKIAGQEVVLYSHGLGIAGRCDLVAWYKGELCIIDFKSSTNTKTLERVEDYKMQLLMYQICHNEIFSTDIKTGIILVGVENGVPQEFKVTFTNDMIGKAIERVDLFYAKLK